MSSYVVELPAVCNWRGQEYSGDSKPGLNRSYKGYQNKYVESVVFQG